MSQHLGAASLAPGFLFVAVLAAIASGCSGSKTTRATAAPDGARSSLTVDRTTNVQANGSDAVQITVTARDATGTPLPNVFVTIAVTGTGNLLQAPVSTNAIGVATGTLASQSIDTKQISGSLTPSGPNAATIAIVETATVQFVLPTAGGSTGNGAPLVTSLSPAQAPVGTTVTISGSGFLGTTLVTFGATKQLSFTVVSPTQITTSVPAGATTGQVSVTTGRGTGVSATPFTVGPLVSGGGGGGAPTITGINPASGTVNATVVLTGTNFTGATLVSFGTTPQPVFSVVSATQIGTTVPAGASTGTISVATPQGIATSTGTFTVMSGSSPLAITAFAPVVGAAGTTILITGTSFGSSPTVLFGATPQPAVLVNPAGTLITLDVPKGAATGDITVAAGGTAVVSSTAFTLPRGTFAAPRSFSSAALSGIAAGDLDRNGKLDLVAAVPGSNQVLVLLGKGDGTFSANTTVTTSLATPSGVALADMNRDGKLDLVVTDAGTSNQLLVFLGDGSGGFPAAPQVSSDASATNPTTVALGDLTGDGLLDAVFGVEADTGVAAASVLVNQGASAPPSFPAAATPLAIGGTPPVKLSALWLGDFHGTGKLDLAVASDSAGPVLFPGAGNATFGSSATVGTSATVVSLASGDFDRSGSLDLVGADNAAASSIFVFLNDGSGAFATQVQVSTAAAHSVGVAVGDVNGDGSADVVTANGDGTVSILLGKGDGTFQSAATTPGVANATAILLVDLDNDGKLDVVIAGPSGGAVLLGN